MLLGLVHCTYVAGSNKRDGEENGEGLGGAEPGTGGKSASHSGGADVGGSGSTPGDGGEPPEPSTGGRTGTGGDPDGAGGESDGGGGALVVARPAHLVVMSKTAGFRHTEAIDVGLAALSTMAAAEDIELTLTEDSSFFTPENLVNVGAIVFLNTSGDILDTTQEAAIEAFIMDGGGFIGIHAAADTEGSWSFYTDLLGAVTTTHSLAVSASIDIDVTNHPATEGLDDPWTRTDEWYNYSPNPRGLPGVVVLLSLDESSYSGGNMGDHPISWVRTVGKSRVFYTGMGCTGSTFSEDDVLGHLRGGVLWTLWRE